MERLYAEKRVKAIGVSNFMQAHLDMLLDQCSVKPMINQVEAHLYFMDYPLIYMCEELDIRIEAYSPLSNGHGLLEDPVLVGIANKYNKTAAQTALRFLIQLGIIPLPKSSNSDRITENIDIFDLSITDEDMTTLKHEQAASYE